VATRKVVEPEAVEPEAVEPEAVEPEAVEPEIDSGIAANLVTLSQSFSWDELAEFHSHDEALHAFCIAQGAAAEAVVADQA
jgi:hypothetical protein